MTSGGIMPCNASFNPSAFTAAPNCDSQSATPCSFSTRFRFFAMLSPISTMTMLTLSLIVDMSPGMVLLMASMPPWNLDCMPIKSALIPVVLSIAPCSAIFMAVGISFPMASARNFHAGTPASASCIISSADTFPLACIWPIALVKRLMPSSPMPSMAAASPIAASIGMMSCDAKPKANNFFDAVKSPGSSKGVSAAKVARSASIFSAALASPSSVVNALRLASMSPASLMLATPKAARAAVAAARPVAMLSDAAIASEPSPLRSARLVLSHFFKKSLLSPPIKIVIEAFPAIVSPHFRQQVFYCRLGFILRYFLFFFWLTAKQHIHRNRLF